MDQKKNQKIVVFLTLTNSDSNLIINGVKAAAIFNKELCLLYRTGLKERKNHRSIENKLNEYLNSLKEKNSLLKTTILITNEKLHYLPEILADDHEAILLIANASAYKMFAKAGTRSPVPFLFVNPDVPASSFHKVVLPIDLRKENSDTALWCSWFGRFAKSEITAVAANEKSRDSQKMIMQNVALTKKLFQKTGVTHKIFKGRKSSFHNSFESMDFALNINADLMVLLGSSVITPLDLILGLPERKIIGKAGPMPILLVNPRRDNYILCD